VFYGVATVLCLPYFALSRLASSAGGVSLPAAAYWACARLLAPGLFPGALSVRLCRGGPQVTWGGRPCAALELRRESRSLAEVVLGALRTGRPGGGAVD